MSELQSCPFCGGIPKEVIDSFSYEIECDCGCKRTGISFANGKVGSTLFVEDFISALYKADKTAVDKWNTRY